MTAAVNHRSLKVLREQRHLNITAVADFTSISPKRLENFEEGTREPSRKQVEKLAETYGISSYALYRDSIPNIPETPKDFRKSEPTSAVLSPKGLRAILAAERVAGFAAQLNEALEFKSFVAPENASRVKAEPALAAATLRAAFDEWLGVRIKKLELTGPPEQQFFGALRLFFEARGRVLQNNEAPASDFLGFFMEPPSGLPVAFVSRSISSKKAQLFTLAHEYAHALMREEGISNPYVLKNSIERKCNQFAAEFLAPLEQFRKIAEGASKATRSDVIAFASAISAQGFLSKHATAIRLFEAGYVSQKQLDQFQAVWARHPRAEKDEEKEERGESTGGAVHAKRIGELGYVPVFLAAKAVEKKLIDSIDVQRGLGLAETLQPAAFALATRRISAAVEK